MNTLTLKQRFMALVAVLLIVFIAIGIFSYYSFSKISRLNHLADTVQELEIITLELRKNEKNFLAREVISKNYFETGESKYIKNYNKALEMAIAHCEILHNSKIILNSEADDKIEVVEKYFIEYGKTFSEIEQKVKERGFKDWGLQGELRSYIHNVETKVNQLEIDKAEVNMLSLRRHEKDYLLRKDLSYKDKFTLEIQNFSSNLDGFRISTTDRDEIKDLLVKYEQAFYNLIQLDVEIGLSENEGLMGLLRNEIHQIEPEIKALHNIVLKITDNESSRALIVLVIFILLGTVCAIVFSIFIMRVIYKLLGGEPSEVANIAESISKGNLNLKLNNSDEYIGLLKSMVYMKEKLESILTGVMKNANTIVSASEQLSSTSEQISQGANESASAVEEVSSTVEEISANIQQNTENSQQTDKIASSAQAGIQSVNEQASESLEANRTISKKIKIINDIAFQTNILALNAAVEAARAGEHGKGFAVVAAEVRKLAEGSKLAADEIIELTKNSLNLSELTGSKLSEMLPEIQKTSELIQEITAASVEQNNGVSQVNNAIQQLNSVAQQNASASEEMASNSKELEEQAANLMELISYFKIKNIQSATKRTPLTNLKSKPENIDLSTKTQAIKVQQVKPAQVEINLDDSDFESF